MKYVKYVAIGWVLVTGFVITEDRIQLPADAVRHVTEYEQFHLICEREDFPIVGEEGDAIQQSCEDGLVPFIPEGYAAYLALPEYREE